MTSFQRGPARPEGPSDRARTIANNLSVDSVTAEVVTALREAGTASILLKGPSVVRWLYEPDRPRPYADIDLLVAPPQRDAERVLEGMGFWRHPLESPRHSVPWLREHGPAVDVHATLFGLGAPTETVWEALWGRVESLEVGGMAVSVLEPTARAMLVVLHAAAHGAGWPRPMEDLARAMERVPKETWLAAAGLAAALGGSAAFASGLRLHPAGAALADRLGLPRERSVTLALRAQSASPGTLALEEALGARGIRAKVRLFTSLALRPPAASPWESHPQQAMARAARRVRWLAHVVRRSPAVVRVWWRARRAAVPRGPAVR